MSSMPRSIGNEFDAWKRNAYRPEGGFYKREALPAMDWLRNNSGTPAALARTTSGTVGFDFISDGTTTAGMIGLTWNATADNTQAIQRNWSIPDDFRRPGSRTGEKSSIILRARVRLQGSGSANDDIQFKLDAAIHCPTLKIQRAGAAAGASAESLEGSESDGDTSITAVTGIVGKTIADQQAGTASTACYVPTKSAQANIEKTRWMEWDIGAALTSAQLEAVKAGGTIGLKVYPDQAIGTSLTLDTSNWEIVYTGNEQPANVRNRALGGRHS